MSERNPPIWLQSGTYSAQDDRIVTGLLVDRRTDRFGNFLGLDAGVVPPLDQMRVRAQGGVSMDFNVSSGVAVIPAEDRDPPGAYLIANEGNYSSASSNNSIRAETSGNPRIDLIVARVYDSTWSGQTSKWAIEVKRGTPAPSPKTPRIDSYEHSIPLAAVTVLPRGKNGGVNKITNEQIQDLRQFVAAPGGVHLWWRSSQSPAPPSSPGRLVYDVSKRSLYLSAFDPGQDRMILDPVYTFNEWRSYFAAFRPRQLTIGTYLYVTSNEWVSEPRRQNNDKRISSPITIDKVRAPNRLVKVSVMSFGRTTHRDSSGHISVAVRSGKGRAEFEPQISRSIGFYNKTWEHHGATWLIGGLPPDENLQVSLRFTQRDLPEKAEGRAIFGKTILMVEPVL